jgi:LmbE family N-acetylglucosaminyl deacetylase
VRLAEARTAAELLGVHKRITLPLTNRRLFDGFDERVALAKVFRRWRPKLVLGLGDRTPMASPDHWQAMQITDAAVFYSRLTKWDDQFEGLPPHTIKAQIYYPLTFYTLQPPPTANDFVVDIGSVLERKLAAIRAYETQFPPEKGDIFDRVRAMAMSIGNAAGFAAGERLASPRAIGVTDLMQSLRI